MNFKDWKDTAELIGIAAVLIGLLLVYLEISQNSEIARAELTSGTIDKIDALYGQLVDPEIAAIYTKGLDAPHELTKAERLQLNVFFEGVLRIFNRERLLKTVGVFEDAVFFERVHAPVFFSDGYGEIWLAVRKETMSSRARESIDAALAQSREAQGAIGPGPITQLDGKIAEAIDRN